MRALFIILSRCSGAPSDKLLWIKDQRICIYCVQSRFHFNSLPWLWSLFMVHFLPLYNSCFSFPLSCTLPPSFGSLLFFCILSLFLYTHLTFSLVLSPFPFALYCSQVQAIDNFSVKFLWRHFIAPATSIAILSQPQKCKTEWSF